jgi:hypothetical protein
VVVTEGVAVYEDEVAPDMVEPVQVDPPEELPVYHW